MRWFKPKRKVFLIMWDDHIVQCDAEKTDAGWCAQWTCHYKAWVILLPDGTTKGDKLVKGWLPHTGWPSNKVKE